MRLAAAFSLFPYFRFAVGTALWPTILAVWHAPSLLFRPQALSRLFMSHVWNIFGNGIDSAARDVKQALITPHAYGIVLDLARVGLFRLAEIVMDFIWRVGHGHTVNYLDHSRVTKYVAVEPNVNMHAELRRAASAAGYSEDTGTLLILSCGAEDISTILSSLPAPHPPVDTLVSILTICSIPSPQATISTLVTEVLKPGGQVLFYEHVLSDREDVARWQRLWTPIWGIAFDGCRLDRPSHRWIEDVGGWVKDEGGVWGKEGESEESLFRHRVGRLVKAG